MKKEITVKTSSVYDARALAELVALANEFSSQIMIEMGSRRVNVKSIMGVMGMGLDVGKVITIEAEGNDEESNVREQARARLQQLLGLLGLNLNQIPPDCRTNKANNTGQRVTFHFHLGKPLSCKDLFSSKTSLPPYGYKEMLSKSFWKCPKGTIPFGHPSWSPRAYLHSG